MLSRLLLSLLPLHTSQERIQSRSVSPYLARAGSRRGSGHRECDSQKGTRGGMTPATPDRGLVSPARHFKGWEVSVQGPGSIGITRPGATSVWSADKRR
jgi:hypothetical protein